MGRRQAQKNVYVDSASSAATSAARTQDQQNTDTRAMYQRNAQMNDNSSTHDANSFYGGGKQKPVTVRTALAEDFDDAEEDLELPENNRGGSFVDQFLATLERSVQQKRRDWVSSLLEMVIPLVFVVGTIILWVAFGDEKNEEKSMLDLERSTSAVIADYYKQLVCNNQSMGQIPGLSPCEYVNFDYDCSGDESTLPLKGLCFNRTLTGTGVVGFFLNSLLGNSAMVPPLDTIIIHQWMARKSMTGDDSAATAALTTSGLAANTRMNAIMCSGDLFFTPAAKVPEGLIDYFNETSLYFQYVYGGMFDTIEEANEHVKNAGTYNWAVVEIIDWDDASFNVRLHMNSSALPTLTKAIDITYPGGFQFDRGEMYIASGFSSLQKTLYEYYLISVLDYNDTALVNPYFVSFGSGPYTRKLLLETAAQLVAFILVLSYLYPVSQLTKKIVLEKELRIREAMLIMGLSNASLYLCWFVIYALQYLVECILMVVLLKASYVVSSDALTLFLVFYIFALTTIPLSGLIASFFSKARLASMMAPIIFFALSVPIFAFTSASASVITGVSVLSPTAFAAFISDVLTFETSVGFVFNDIHSNRVDPQPSLILIFLGIDFVVYYLLMFYFDAVLPKDWGTTKNPLFCIIEPFKACINCCCRESDEERMKGDNEDGRAPEGVFEDVDDNDSAVRIVGLRKEFSRGGKKFVAVNNFYWNMREKEISVLLGHNGAGKSTTMNMMTGMTEPDQGDCFIFGNSVRYELDKVRQQIGFCPQHNILWPELTCREHLEYFGKIKGLRGPKLENAVRIMLKEVDLLDKIEYASSALSGGQKRKLSVAVAFVGQSRLVFLDEPTAGMDVGARRYTWELLRRMAETHTIMLTTHYMDEADLLGHRIGIMSQGRLQCSGSSMFLKSRLGVGYNMNISIDADADAESIDRLVTSLVPSAEAADFNGCEIMYKLPMKDVQLFPDLLSGLESNGESIGVRGYSLSATTLEEVFLQIALDDMNRHKANDSEGKTEDEMEKENALVWSCELLKSASAKRTSQFKVMMTKRLWNSLRDRRMQCFQIACPVVCILLAMLLTLVNFSSTGNIDLSPSMFGEQIEMEVSNCSNFFGEIANETRQGALIHDRRFRNTQDMSYYTIDTVKEHPYPRYTSIFCDEPALSEYTPNEGSATMLFYNTSAYHASGLVLTQLYSFILQKLTGDSSRVFATSTAPMPQSASDKQAQGGVQTILIGAIVMIPFTFLPSNPVAWVVKERECKARHLQNVSGLSFTIYWITNFLFDMAAYVVTLILVIIIFAIFSRDEYVSSATIGPTVTMFLVYGLCSTVAAYAISFAFGEHSTAQTVTMAVSFVAGFLLVMMVFILSLVESTADASENLRWPFRVVPSYCVGESIINLAMNQQQLAFGEGKSPWSMDVVGWPCVYMAIEFPIFVILTLFIDHPRRRMWGEQRSYDRLAPAEIIDDEDSDVEDERKQVYDQESKEVNEDIVRVVDLRKVYDNGKVAVRNLAFSILPDEVFGFLGTNGAGKTTAISMLCQEFIPTSGSAYVCGYDIVAESQEALACIGYCPQFDATLDLLTVEEHLMMYAGIRGIEYEQREPIVSGLMRLCGISEYRKTTSVQLSGGNRRKLSVAMCLIGSPQIVFLDEPSAGMDPVARRGLWATIQKVSQNCSVVLTTHHLEEVEALADTVAIMADGALRCIGDKIHLKNKYGSGFEMSVRISDKAMRNEVERFVMQAFPDAVLNEFKGQRFVFALPHDVLLSEVFSILQQNQQRFGITDYSVSQTSIEQVFLRISEEQELRGKLRSENDKTRFTKSHAQLHSYKGMVKSSAKDKPPKEAKINVSSEALTAYLKKREMEEQQQKRGNADASSATSVRTAAAPVQQATSPESFQATSPQSLMVSPAAASAVPVSPQQQQSAMVNGGYGDASAESPQFANSRTAPTATPTRRTPTVRICEPSAPAMDVAALMAGQTATTTMGDGGDGYQMYDPYAGMQQQGYPTANVYANAYDPNYGASAANVYGGGDGYDNMGYGAVAQNLYANAYGGGYDMTQAGGYAQVADPYSNAYSAAGGGAYDDGQARLSQRY